MLKPTRLALLALLILVAAPAATVHAATRMPIGFFDDPTFRWSAARADNLQEASAAGASVIHTTASWPQLAPKKPRNALNGNDPAYKLADLDELVFQSGVHNLRVMINITGTPKWANGGKAANVMPKRLADLTAFSRMLATRYNGRTGHGSVSLYSVWNEPNLQLFLTPQFVGQEDRRPGELREALQVGVRRHQGREQAREGRGGRDLRAWARQAARGQQRDRRPRHLREGARQGEGPEVRRLGAPPVPDLAEPRRRRRRCAIRTSPSRRCRSSRPT